MSDHALRKDGQETKRRILTACVRLFLEQGYKATTITQITREARVSRGSFQNIFPTKDAVLLDLTKTMFDGQFGMARGITGAELPPVYTYAVETAIQLALVESNENLREIYVEAYTQPDAAQFIRLHTAVELERIFGAYLPGLSSSDFYELDVGTSGLMRGFMAEPCDARFPLARKIERFLTLSLRAYKVPEDEQEKVLALVAGLDIEAVAEKVMAGLFSMLEMKYDFKLSKDGETEE